MQDNTELLNKIYSCVLDMQKDIKELKQRVDRLEERMDSLEKRMDALEKRMDGLEGEVKDLETRMKKYINESIETLQVVLEDQIDHLEITVRRPKKLYIAEEQAQYNV